MRKLQQKYKIGKKRFRTRIVQKSTKYLIISMYKNEAQQPLKNTSKISFAFYNPHPCINRRRMMNWTKDFKLVKFLR